MSSLISASSIPSRILGRFNGLFVTATDTGVGKTIVAAWLARCLTAAYWKPIQCGVDEEGRTDSQIVADLADLPADRLFAERYCLPDPLSPHEAARRAGVVIDWQALRMPSHRRRPLIVEGAGGALVPVTSYHTMIDVMAVLELPILVVVRPTLGTINHSLLTLEALRSRNLRVAGVVFYGLPEPHVREAIIDFGHTALVAELPYLSSCSCEDIARMAFTVRPRLDATMGR